ncbi:MAG: ABC-three component system protein, partial [Eubacterium sp.]
LIYDVAVIDPDVSPDNPSNLIALCPECAAKYAALKKPDDIARMTDIKKSLVEAHDDQEIRSDQHVQEGVRRVIEKIPFITPPVDIDLNYDPVPVKQKISDFSLYLRIKTEVNVYFNDVHEVFQQMGREGRLRFNPFCQQVRYMYVSFRDKGYSQDKIFYEMTKWLFDATHEKWGDCEIVIAYFTQKCEAFDVIA